MEVKMAKRGRKPTPAAIVELRGNPGKRARRKPAVKGQGVELQPPPVLRQVAGALEWWRTLLGSMHPALRVPAAMPTLSTCALLLATRDAAARKLRAGLFTTRDGVLDTNRAFHVLVKSGEAARKAANDLAISPTELARFGLDLEPSQPG
jgi:hypothetical protein